MLQSGAEQIFQNPMEAGTNDFQELSKTKVAVSGTKTALGHPFPAGDASIGNKGILTQYLTPCFREAGRFHRRSRTEWFPAFLELVPSPNMVQAGVHPSRLGGGRAHSREVFHVVRCFRDGKGIGRIARDAGFRRTPEFRMMLWPGAEV